MTTAALAVRAPSGLVDIHGRPLRAQRATVPYDNAGAGRRFVGFNAPNIGPNVAIGGGLEKLRARSRALMRNNAIVWKGVKTRVANVIGTGIDPHPQLEDPTLRATVKQAFEDWAIEADADGRTDLYGLQALWAASIFVDGEVLVRFRPRLEEDDLFLPLQLQTLEGDHLPVTLNKTLTNGNVVRAGIEFDLIGRRAAYWLYKTHPTDVVPFGGSGLQELTRVPASEVLHLFELGRPGQLRGEPALSRILLRAHDKDKTDDATLLRRQVASMFAFFFTRTGDGTSPVDDAEREGADGDDTRTYPTIEAGSSIGLDPGETVTFPTLPDEGAAYADVQHELNLYLAAGLGVPYESATGDYAGVTYSSIRAARLEFQRWCEQLQAHTFVPGLRVLYRQFFDLAQMMGALSITTAAYRTNRRTFLRANWVGQGWPWVDPLKEGLAAKNAVRSGWTTNARVIAATSGATPDEIRAERKAELKADDDDRLVNDTDPRKVDGTGALDHAVATAPEPAAAGGRPAAARGRR